MADIALLVSDFINIIDFMKEIFIKVKEGALIMLKRVNSSGKYNNYKHICF